MIFADVDENDIVAGANAGAGASDVVFVRDITDRPLSRNSTIAYAFSINMDIGWVMAPLTLVSVMGLYRLSVSGPSVFCNGTTKVGTVPVTMLSRLLLQFVRK